MMGAFIYSFFSNRGNVSRSLRTRYVPTYSISTVLSAVMYIVEYRGTRTYNHSVQPILRRTGLCVQNAS